MEDSLTKFVASTEVFQSESNYVDLKTYYKTITNECVALLRDICELHSNRMGDDILQNSNSADIIVADKSKAIPNEQLFQQLSEKTDKFQKLVAVHLLSFDRHVTGQENDFNIEKFQRSIDGIIQGIECDREYFAQKKEKIQFCLEHVDDTTNYKILGGILFAMNRRVDSINSLLEKEIEIFGALQLPNGEVGNITLADIPSGLNKGILK